MDFEHPIQQEIHQKVQEYLLELFEQPFENTEDGRFYVRYGTTVLEISVEPYGPEDAVVRITAFCVQGVEVEEKLLLGLLELNYSLPFGAFSLVGQDIFFSHSLFGRTLERRNLLGAIAAVATVSDDYDERIVAKYGGQTALQRTQEEAEDEGAE